MELLVSVSSADEARAAMAGGADIIDAKNPAAGALGAVSLDVLTAIRRVVGTDRMLTAALGDEIDAAAAARMAAEFVVRGASLVKIGFADVSHASRVAEIIESAARSCAERDERTGVVAVAYADELPDETTDAMRFISVAARSGARGVLVDTRDKSGPSLTSLWDATRIARWVAEVKRHGLVAAVAGRLAPPDLDVARGSGADIAGVRGAACDGGRRGRVSADRVRELVARCHDGESAVRRASTSSAWTMQVATPGGSARVR